jgi:PAS domain S-box-containing protein
MSQATDSAQGTARNTVLIVALCAAIFALDIVAPLGRAEWVLYIPALLLTYRSPGRGAPFLCAAACTVLVTLGLFLSPPGLASWSAALNRALGASVVWVTAVLVGHQKRTDEQHKQVEAAARETGTYLRQVISSAQEGIVVYGKNLHYEVWNPFMEKLTGLASKEVLGKHPLEVFPFLRDNGVYAAVERARAGESISLPDMPFHLAQAGKWGWVAATLAPLRDAGGEIVGVISIVSDVTGRMQAQKALAASEKRFRALVEKSAEGVSLFTADGINAYFTPNTPKLFGRSPGEISGHSPFEYMHPDDAPLCANLFAELLQQPGRSITKEFRYSRSDGSWVWIEVTATNLLHERGVEAIVANYRDITERVDKEQTLRESEAKFRALADTTAGAIFLYEDDRLTYVNPAATAFTGFSRDELLGMSIWKLIHPDFHVHVQRRRGARERGESISERSELKFITKGGEERWAAYSAGFVEIDERHVGITTAFDITERKQAETALRRSEKRLRDLIDGLGPQMFVGLMTPDGTLIEANRPALAAAGLEPNDVLGKPVEETYWLAYSEEVQRQLRAAIVRAQNGESSRYDMQIRVAEQQLIDIDFSLQPLRDEAGHIVFLVASGNVITERKRAEAALRKSEQKFSMLFEKAAFAAALSRLPDGVIVEVNEEFEKVFGYSKQEVAGKTSLELGIFRLEDRERMVAEFRARGSMRDQEFTMRTKSGERRVMLVNSDLVEIGGQQHILTTTHDITERKQAEAEREHLQAELRRSETMAALGSPVGGVAHELRNPLFGISATLDAFEAKTGKRPEYQPYLEVLRGEVARLTALTRDLMDYGKPPAVNLAPGSVEEVIAQAVKGCATLAERSGVQVSVDGGEKLPEVPIDRERLLQVFQNLIQNAIQHSPTGHAVIVHARQAQHDGRLWIETDVKDSGPGFSSEDLPKVFEPFFSRRKGGTGLGLSIVQRIVEQHGGTVSAANRPEGGALVRVRLPVG